MKRSVYLPNLNSGHWKQNNGKVFDGGQYVKVEAPIDLMPVFEKVTE